MPYCIVRFYKDKTKFKGIALTKKGKPKYENAQDGGPLWFVHEEDAKRFLVYCKKTLPNYKNHFSKNQLSWKIIEDNDVLLEV